MRIQRVVCVKFCKSGSGISVVVQAAACRMASFFCSLRKDIFKYRVASIQFFRVSVARARINRRQLSRLGKNRTTWGPPLDLFVDPFEHVGRLHVVVVLDRLLHHGHILKCGPRSWRTKTGLADSNRKG